jgi:hypothetical protein
MGMVLVPKAQRVSCEVEVRRSTMLVLHCTVKCVFLLIVGDRFAACRIAAMRLLIGAAGITNANILRLDWWQNQSATVACHRMVLHW